MCRTAWLGVGSDNCKWQKDEEFLICCANEKLSLELRHVVAAVSS